MSGSHWPIRGADLAGIVAFSTATAIALFTLFPPNLPPSEHETHHRTAQTECSYHHRVWGFRTSDGEFIKSPYAEAGQSSAEKEKQIREWCDLAAQHLTAKAGVKAANSAWWTAVLTWIGVLLLAGTLFATFRTLKEAERTTKAVLSEQRPWIACKILSVKTFSKRGYHVELELNNIGKTAAKGIRVYHLHKENDNVVMTWPIGFVEASLAENKTLRTRGLTARECMPQGTVTEKVSFRRTLVSSTDDINDTESNCNFLFSDCQGAIVVLYTWGDETETGCNAFTFACRPTPGGLKAAISGKDFPLECWVVRGTERYD